MGQRCPFQQRRRLPSTVRGLLSHLSRNRQKTLGQHCYLRGVQYAPKVWDVLDVRVRVKVSLRPLAFTRRRAGKIGCSSESANSTSKITVAQYYHSAVRVICFSLGIWRSDHIQMVRHTRSIQRVRRVKWCNVVALRVENQSLIERGDNYCCFRGDLSRNLTCFSGH